MTHTTPQGHTYRAQRSTAASTAASTCAGCAAMGDDTLCATLPACYAAAQADGRAIVWVRTTTPKPTR